MEAKLLQSIRRASAQEGRPKENRWNGPQKGDFNGRMSCAIASKVKDFFGDQAIVCAILHFVEFHRNLLEWLGVIQFLAHLMED